LIVIPANPVMIASGSEEYFASIFSIELSRLLMQVNCTALQPSQMQIKISSWIYFID
jgi:hypothetical protein